MHETNHASEFQAVLQQALSNLKKKENNRLGGVMSIFHGFFKPNIERLVKNRDVSGLIKALEYNYSSNIYALPPQEYEESKLIRLYAAKALGELKAKDAVEALLGTFNKDNWEIQMAAVWALGRIGDPAAIDPLKTILFNRLKSPGYGGLNPNEIMIMFEAVIRVGGPVDECIEQIKKHDESLGNILSAVKRG